MPCPLQPSSSPRGGLQRAWKGRRPRGNGRARLHLRSPWTRHSGPVKASSHRQHWQTDRSAPRGQTPRPTTGLQESPWPLCPTRRFPVSRVCSHSRMEASECRSSAARALLRLEAGSHTKCNAVTKALEFDLASKTTGGAQLSETREGNAMWGNGRGRLVTLTECGRSGWLGIELCGVGSRRGWREMLVDGGFEQTSRGWRRENLWKEPLLSQNENNEIFGRSPQLC